MKCELGEASKYQYSVPWNLFLIQFPKLTHCQIFDSHLDHAFLKDKRHLNPASWTFFKLMVMLNKVFMTTMANENLTTVGVHNFLTRSGPIL